MLCVNVDELYNNTEIYRFMPKSIFDALERAFLDGRQTAEVPESDYIRMIIEMQLNDGSQNN